MIVANEGEIWRFVNPKWARPPGKVVHYLIVERYEPPYKRYDFLYCAIDLESGNIVEDLLIDAANMQNYRAECVG